MLNPQKILAISPHTDDIELAAGGALHKMAEQGAEIFYVALSDCQEELKQNNCSIDTLQNECLRALKHIGIPKKNCFIHHLTAKFFYKDSRKIFEILETLRERVHPDLIVIPSTQDTHEDHYVVARQAQIAFRRETSIIAYEQPWNNFSYSPDLFIALSKNDLEIKIKALREYASQYIFKKTYFDTDFIKSLAVVRGKQINTHFAEAFQVIKLIA